MARSTKGHSSVLVSGADPKRKPQGLDSNAKLMPATRSNYNLAGTTRPVGERGGSRRS